MHSARPVALLIAALTLWPMLYMGLFFAAVIGSAATGGTFGSGWLTPWLIAGHVTTMLVMVGLAAYYLVHVLRNTRLDHSQRMVWLLVVLFAAPPGMAVYWWMQIWKEQER